MKVDNKTVYRPKFQVELKQLYNLFIYCGIAFLLIWYLPNTVWNSDYKFWLILLGTLGIWRYIWWFTHFFRSVFYNQVVFTNLRKECGELLDTGWRPKKVVFMVTVYNESQHILENMLASINREANLTKLPFELYIATANKEAEDKIAKIWRWLNVSEYIKLIIVRQILPGKRQAMSSALRCISRRGLGKNDPVVFMDGDTVLTPGIILKLAPIFHVRPTVHALTTNEKAKLRVSDWLIHWFNVRFAQRNMIMQSQALSKRVLTLTGRMSVFRGRVVLDERFINLIENDSLEHWLWGRFKFLSGDDKSTWYALLTMGADMLYVPDALVYTIEEINETPLHRLKENMLRWSGNILRNGWRAIRLGPKKVGFFAWWSLVDQRVVMFSMLVAPTLSISGSVLVSSAFLSMYIIWIMFSRLCLAIALFYHHRKLDMSFPLYLYINQLLTSVFKIYLLFRLPMQKWANRGDQSMPIEGSRPVMLFRRIMSSYMTILLVGAISLVALIYSELLPPLSFNDIDSWLK